MTKHEQGDPLSPILYNIALEPFLRSFTQDSQFSGYTLETLQELRIAQEPHTSVNIKFLCYADDTIVFVRDLRDLNRLNQLLHTYSQASNAKINYNKVQTLSMSDLTSLHSTRSLSVLGRATVANSLILAKCWYLLRVSPIPDEDISRIRTVISRFVNTNIFPKLSWNIFSLPKQQGGLGILDPKIQQAALYFKWIKFVLHQGNHPTTVSLCLRIHLKNSFGTPYHEIPLLLKEGRDTYKPKLLYICNLLVKPLDLIDRDFGGMSRNPQACLLLPIQAVFVSSTGSFRFPRICKDMSVSDVFMYNNELDIIQRRTIDNIDQRYRRSVNKLIRAIASGSLQIFYFFGKHCYSNTNTGVSTSLGNTSPSLFTSFIDCLKFHLPSAYNRRATHPTIPCANWLAFWSLSPTCIERNFIYRLIHRKIPHKDCLYHLLSRPGISPYCSICVVSIDSIDHFFFSCPLKYLVWQEVIREFLWPTLDIAKIRHALCSLDFSEVSYCLNPKLDGDIVLIISLSAI
ncbi:hypothetical protein G6F57_011577 [Rhizopus arrhizus]|uniref:Reverse transcriptase domain-containing protein n=1 Tax=Rhizopus oryzae TaxID=64495 RepID=A0A9P6WXH3_RHIOR|nr:hypothetical protein G6F23_011274 [Rhizopus arrhizus]KAG0753946.1 hypothetical protein G6F24_012704 [Rhizopus arrhizus]KAG0778425.1 hypothetical protein G6F22_011242 [Rhizopus arrhizus]KAG0779800.1 hypothetical protein G6F21_012421 [Rhizopus arrhizus]KAG0806072.1 hypothetical protein G6F20_011416 [Rhizopus arrhizus]